jgi:RNA polymerase sigma-70 factor (ECF subfamily)
MPPVVRARGGDVAAFEALYREHAAPVYRVCVRFAGDPSEAEDFAQDAWVRAWERLASFRGDASFGTWMHRLTVNLILDRKREAARKWNSGSGAEADPDRRAAVLRAPGTRIDLERAVRSLPDGARTVFLLHDVEGYKHREIADLLGIAVGTAKAQLHRARRLLQGALER